MAGINYLLSTFWDLHFCSDVVLFVLDCLSSVDEVGDAIVAGLFQALSDAGNYFDAEAAAKRIDALGTLTHEQFERLEAVYHSNDQVHGSVLASRALSPIFHRNSKTSPPPRLTN